MKPGTISLAMIVCNEERVLADSLASVTGLVDEIVVVDTGSTDRTAEIAARYTDKVFRFTWTEDFSAARNFALDQCTGDWVFVMDADERLMTQGETLRDLLASEPEKEVFFLPVRCRSGGVYNGYDCLPAARMFRHTSSYRFYGRVYEQVRVERPEAAAFAAAPVIAHDFTAENERNSKRYRNLRLLAQEEAYAPGNLLIQYYQALEWMGLGKWELALPRLQRVYASLSDDYRQLRALAVRNLAACLKKIGRLDEAMSICMEEAIRYPDYTDLYFDGGVILEQKGEWEVASRWYAAALETGPSPAVYCHTQGTESFLSLHHLGRCYEKIDRGGQALVCYQQALEENPDFVYPLRNLFLRCMAEISAGDVWDYFKAAGYLKNSQWAVVLSKMFFACGLADVAADCLQELSLSDAQLAGGGRAWYLILSGRPHEGLLLFEQMRRGAELLPEALLYEAVGFVLTENYTAARRRAFGLWKQEESRDMAWMVLNLAGLAESGRPAGQPEAARRPRVLQYALRVYDDIVRCQVWCRESGRADRRSAERLENALMQMIGSSAEGCLCLVEYCRRRSKAMSQNIVYKYGLQGDWTDDCRFENKLVPDSQK